MAECDTKQKNEIKYLLLFVALILEESEPTPPGDLNTQGLSCVKEEKLIPFCIKFQHKPHMIKFA